jgi:CheY-like chemotaxis protein
MEHQYSLLLVDDEEANRLLITRRLQQEGWHVATAENGRRALELLALERFDLVLLDMNMPEMDGLATLDAIKSDDKLKNMPVVMLTAAKDRESVVQCLSLGAADYLVKPVNAVELRQRVRRCLEARARHFEPTIRLDASAAAGARILIVDDEPLNLRLLEARLGQLGFKPLPAASGAAALALLQREAVSALLLDIRMPDMDGFAVLRAVRGNLEHSGLPIVMLSADADPATIERCYEMGADDYLVKPYHTVDLKVRLTLALELRQGK